LKAEVQEGPGSPEYKLFQKGRYPADSGRTKGRKIVGLKVQLSVEKLMAYLETSRYLKLLKKTAGAVNQWRPFLYFQKIIQSFSMNDAI